MNRKTFTLLAIYFILLFQLISCSHDDNSSNVRLPSHEVLQAIEFDNPPADNGGLGGDTESVGGAVAKWIGQQVASGIIGTIAGKTVGNFLAGLIGVTDPSAEIINKLSQIQSQLNAISIQVEYIATVVTNTLKEIGLTRDAILTQLQVNNIKPAEDVINQDFSEYKSALNTDPSLRYTDAQLLEWADQVLSTAKHDVPGKLSSMHSSIVGGTVGDEGFLRILTQSLINKYRADTSSDVYKYYQPLHEYFSELLTIQFKGMAMMMEAQGIKDKPSKTSVGYAGTAAQYRRTQFLPHIDEQLKLFMQCVDQLVMCKGTPNTSNFLWIGLNQHSASACYTEADKLLAQISNTFYDITDYTPYPWGRHAHVFLHYGADAPHIVDGVAAQKGQYNEIFSPSNIKNTYDVESYVQTYLNSSDDFVRDLRILNKADVRIYHDFSPVRHSFNHPVYQLLLVWPDNNYGESDYDTIATGAFYETSFSDPVNSDEPVRQIGSVVIDGRRYIPSKFKATSWNYVGSQINTPVYSFPSAVNHSPAAAGMTYTLAGKAVSSNYESYKLWTGFNYKGDTDAILKLAYHLVDNITFDPISGGDYIIWKHTRQENLNRGNIVASTNKTDNQDTVHLSTVNITKTYDILELPVDVSTGDTLGFEPTAYLSRIDNVGTVIYSAFSETVTIGWMRWQVKTE